MIDCSITENYFAERRRMTMTAKYGICKLDCTKCPLSSKNNGTSENLSCANLEIHYPERAVAIVQKWSNEHPQKTYLSEFLKKYPKVVDKVKLSKWVKKKDRKVGEAEAYCLTCGREVVYQVINNRYQFENYCPHCGARMDLER